MKKYIIWILILIITGNIIRLVAEHQEMNLTRPIIWGLGTIWFILFLVYGLGPVVANLLEERKY